MPMVLAGSDTERWLTGQKPAGAVYAAGDHVVVRNGPVCGQRGTVVMLADLAPEPRYLVVIGRGHYAQVRQSDLAPAAG